MVVSPLIESKRHLDKVHSLILIFPEKNRRGDIGKSSLILRDVSVKEEGKELEVREKDFFSNFVFKVSNQKLNGKSIKGNFLRVDFLPQLRSFLLVPNVKSVAFSHCYNVILPDARF